MRRGGKNARSLPQQCIPATKPVYVSPEGGVEVGLTL